MPTPRNRLTWQATCKVYPAIADTSAISGFVRVADTDMNVGAPDFLNLMYTVPAGQIFVLEALRAWCFQADPTFVEFYLQLGVTGYSFYRAPYGGALESHLFANPLRVNEAEKINVFWEGTLATTDVASTLFGYLIDKY